MRPALALATVVVALAAPPAQAETGWQSGEIETSTVLNCSFFPETGINSLAQFQADPRALPRVGDLFYVRTIPARVGNGCGIPMHVHVEVVLPVGVTTAISAATPVRCLLWDYVTDEATPLAGCPQTPQAGTYGPAFDQEGPTGIRPWEIPYRRGVVIELPLRSSRALKGVAGRPITCSRLSGRPPCPAAAAGDNIQLANWISDGIGDPWLSPSVPLFVEAAAPPPPVITPTPTPAPPAAAPAPVPVINKAPATVRVRRALRVTAFVVTRGSTVTARLVLKGRTLAAKTLRRAPAGLNRLTLIPRKPGRAELRVTVRAPDGSTRTETKRVTVKR